MYYEMDQLRTLLKIQPTLIAIFILLFLSVSPVNIHIKLLRHLLVKLELLLNIHLIFHIFPRHVICHFIFLLLFFLTFLRQQNLPEFYSYPVSVIYVFNSHLGVLLNYYNFLFYLIKFIMLMLMLFLKEPN